MTDDAQQSPGAGEENTLSAPLRHLLAILIGAATGLVFYGGFRLVVHLFN